jgi:predicted ATPase
MKVVWLEIKNFRSIKELRIEDLDKPQVIIEGPNDVGKSNILRALDLALRALPAQLRKSANLGTSIPGESCAEPSWIRDPKSLFHRGTSRFEIALGMRFDLGDQARGWIPDPSQMYIFRLTWSLTEQAGGFEPELSMGRMPPQQLDGMAWALASAFRLVSTQRAPQRETLIMSSSSSWEEMARWEGSNLKRLLFLYKNSPEIEIQERFERLRSAASTPDLGIGVMNVAVRPDQTLDIRTRHEGLELDLEERGSGVQQLLTLLALALCHRGKLLAVEEPEMNLSEPNQRLLWKKLCGFSGPSGPLDQVFVSSHSRVFEEEAARLIVSRDTEHGTQARWAEPVPNRQRPEDELLQVTRGGGVTLPVAALNHLGVHEGRHLYLVPTERGYQLLGAQGYADLLREEE